MGTTANRAIPYPAPTELVTNGAAAMQALAEAVDVDLEALGDALSEDQAVTGDSSPGQGRLKFRVFKGHVNTDANNRFTVAIPGGAFPVGVAFVAAHQTDTHNSPFGPIEPIRPEVLGPTSVQFRCAAANLSNLHVMILFVGI